MWNALAMPLWGVAVRRTRCRSASADDLLEEAVAQMRAVVGRDAGVGLVDDDELRARADELVAADVGLDVVEADDGERMRPEDAVRLEERPFEPSGRRRGDGDSGDQEFRRQLLHPLVDEVRRAEDGDAFDLAAVEQFAGDQAALDRLADADVVGDQEPHGVQLHRHHQRDKLVGLGLEHDAARAAERPGAAAEREAKRVAHELRLVLRADAAAVRGREGRRHDGIEFDVGKQASARRLRSPITGAGSACRASVPGRTTHSRPRALTRFPGEKRGTAFIRLLRGLRPGRRSSQARQGRRDRRGSPSAPCRRRGADVLTGRPLGAATTRAARQT